MSTRIQCMAAYEFVIELQEFCGASPTPYKELMSNVLLINVLV